VVEREIERREIFDPYVQEFVKEELPTVTVKKAARWTGSRSEGTFVHYHVPGPGTISGDWRPGKVMRITRLAVGATQEAKFFVKDRAGTIDHPYLEAAGREVTLGAPTAPVCVVAGSFAVGIGSVAAGTYWCSFEGVLPRFGTEVIPGTV